MELSMECEPLARSEALAVARTLGTVSESVLEDNGVLVLETDANPTEFVKRIALCHSVSEFICSCTPGEVEEEASLVDLPGPIRVHSTRIGTSHAEIDLNSVNRNVGAILARNSGVDIHNPVSELRVVYSKGVYMGRLLGSVDRASYETRKTRNMPFDHPVSIHPKFARCLVNLTEVRPGERLLDPFCGTGAILAEAALIGAEAIGADVSKRMIDGTRTNLDALNVKANLHISDVGTLGEQVDRVNGVATDPPYGRSSSTNQEPLESLMARALTAFSDVLDPGSKVAMAIADIGLLDGAEAFRLRDSHNLWVHRSLIRHFCVLERV